MIDATIHNKAVANKNEGQENNKDNQTNRLFGSRQGLDLHGDVVIEHIEHDHGSITEAASRAQESRKHHDSTGHTGFVRDKREETHLTFSISIHFSSTLVMVLHPGLCFFAFHG